MPVVFISHGAPDALMKAQDAVACWRDGRILRIASTDNTILYRLEPSLEPIIFARCTG
jgi:hypothetical protein